MGEMYFLQPSCMNQSLHDDGILPCMVHIGTPNTDAHAIESDFSEILSLVCPHTKELCRCGLIPIWKKMRCYMDIFSNYRAYLMWLVRSLGAPMLPMYVVCNHSSS